AGGHGLRSLGARKRYLARRDGDDDKLARLGMRDAAAQEPGERATNATLVRAGRAFIKASQNQRGVAAQDNLLAEIEALARGQLDGAVRRDHRGQFQQFLLAE